MAETKSKFKWEDFNAKEFFRDTDRVAKIFTEVKESNAD